MTREPNAAEDIYFKEAQPIGIGNIEKRFDLEDAEVIDQNIGFGRLFEGMLPRHGTCRGRRECRGHRHF